MCVCCIWEASARTCLHFSTSLFQNGQNLSSGVELHCVFTCFVSYRLFVPNMSSVYASHTSPRLYDVHVAKEKRGPQGSANLKRPKNASQTRLTIRLPVFTVGTLMLNRPLRICLQTLCTQPSKRWLIHFQTQIFFTRRAHVMHMSLCWISEYEWSLFIFGEPDTVMQHHIMGSRWKEYMGNGGKKVMRQQICTANWVQLVWPRSLATLKKKKKKKKKDVCN